MPTRKSDFEAIDHLLGVMLPDPRQSEDLPAKDLQEMEDMLRWWRYQLMLVPVKGKGRRPQARTEAIREWVIAYCWYEPPPKGINERAAWEVKLQRAVVDELAPLLEDEDHADEIVQQALATLDR